MTLYEPGLVLCYASKIHHIASPVWLFRNEAVSVFSLGRLRGVKGRKPAGRGGTTVISWSARHAQFKVRNAFVVRLAQLQIQNDEKKINKFKFYRA